MLYALLTNIFKVPRFHVLVAKEYQFKQVSVLVLFLYTVVSNVLFRMIRTFKNEVLLFFLNSYLNLMFGRKEFNCWSTYSMEDSLTNVKVSSTYLLQKHKWCFNLGTIHFSNSTIIIPARTGCLSIRMLVFRFYPRQSLGYFLYCRKMFFGPKVLFAPCWFLKDILCSLT